MIRRIAAVLRPRDPRATEAGFSIAEVMVAMMVFAIISVGIAAGIINALVLTQDGKSRVVAVQLASQAIDLERAETDIFNVNGGMVQTTATPKVGNITYTVVETATWADASGAVNGCGLSGNTTALANKSVDVTVSWKSKSNFGQTAPVRMTALIAPGTDSVDPNTGVIFIGVTNATGTGSAGVSVNITVNPAGAGGQALTTQPTVTTSAGCSVARGVQPGDYIVKISRSNGIDYQQQTAPTKSVTVTKGGSTTASFQYDTASTVTPQIGNNGAALPTNIALTYRNAAGDFTVAGTGTTKLFPFTDGYRVMAGSFTATPLGAACTDRDPSAWAPGADTKVGVAVPTATTTPGNVATFDFPTVPMGTVTVKTGLANATITATPTSVLDAGDPGCNTSPKTAYTFAAATNNSSSQNIALPYGTYTISVSTILGLPVVLGNSISAANGTKATISGMTVMVDPRTASS